MSAPATAGRPLRLRRGLLALLLVGALLAAAASLLRLAVAPGAAGGAAWDPAVLLGGAAAPGFARVTAGAPFAFPRDHGAHPAYRHEWWYLTANLADAEGQRYGLQLTFFRFALAPPAAPAANGSAWRSDQLYMAHLALTDAAGGRFQAWERFARPVLGLAGAEAAPFRVWLEDWVLAGGADGLFPLRLQAAADGQAATLLLRPRKPPVAHGDAGTSRKGPEPGNASRYYAFTRLEASGELRLDGRTLAVDGSAWLDREWGTSALGAGVAGWDWFALQLDDGRDLMLYRLRRADGSSDPYSAGSLVAADGTPTPLAADAFSIEVLQQRDSRLGTRYPSRWRLRVPRAGLDLQVSPLLDEQELALSVRYWEGAVVASGSVGGRGYAELTGYAGASGPGRR